MADVTNEGLSVRHDDTHDEPARMVLLLHSAAQVPYEKVEDTHDVQDDIDPNFVGYIE